jgi:protein SCO1/2
MANPNVLDVRQEAAAMQDRLGAVVNGELTFTDSRGYPLKLKQFFPGKRPVILNLNYFGCPKMCGEVMNAMVDALNEVALEPGSDYEILSISIDPRETVDLARQKKASFLVKLGKLGAERGWHFAVGDKAAIHELADSVGFRFFWAEHDNRFDHPPALVFLSPEGKVTRVLQGTVFSPSDMKLALVEASAGKVGTFWDQVVLGCLTFDPKTRTYALTAMTVMKIGGAITVLALAAMIYAMVRRERRRLAPAPSA